MKLKQISLAVSAAFSVVGAGQALALPLSSYDSNTINVFTAGATAQDNTIRAYMRYVCAAGTLDEYRGPSVSQTQPAGGNIYNGSPSNVNQTMYFCTLDGTRLPAAFGALSGRKVLLRKSSGDSGEGVAVSSGALVINWMASPSINGTNVGTNYSCTTLNATTAASGNLRAINQFNCSTTPTTNNVGTAGVAGFADVEPGLLNAILTPSASSATIGAMTKNAIAAQTWGIAVSRNLRNALQKVQGLTVGDDTEAGMPSLPKNVITGIFLGQLTTWDLLTDGANNALSSAAVLGTLPAPANSDVWLVRRPDSSGTQTSIKATFLNNPCSTGSNMVTGFADACGTAHTSPHVNVQQGTGGLLSCLGTLNNTGKWGIGFASTANRPVENFGATNATDAGWRWIKVDGRAATIYNAAIGKYDFQTEGTLSWGGGAVPSGSSLQFLQMASAQMSDPNVLGAVNSGAANQNYSAVPFQMGALCTASNIDCFPTYPITVAGTTANPVATVTRSYLVPNSCQPLTIFGLNIPVNQQ